MLASTPADFVVELLLSFDAVVLSWTTIVSRSPTRLARLSAYIGRETSSRQSDCDRANAGANASASRRQRMKPRRKSKQDDDGLFIEDLSTKIAARLGVARANDLSGC